MGKKELQAQTVLIKRTLFDAPESVRRSALDGTIGDAQGFCWAGLRQLDRHRGPGAISTPRDWGLWHADLHMLLLVAHETVSHVEQIEKLLASIGETRELPPDRALRRRLREARNLLAEHRDERVLYWRLTHEHTPHVTETFTRLNVPLPNGSIDTISGVNVGGDLLSLHELEDALHRLEVDLDALAAIHRGGGEAPTAVD